MHDTDEYVGTATEARLAGVSQVTAWTWGASGRLPSVRVMQGNRPCLRYRRADVERFLAAREQRQAERAALATDRAEG